MFEKLICFIWDACPFPPGLEPPRKEGLFSTIVNGRSTNSLINYEKWYIVLSLLVFFITVYVLLCNSPLILLLWMFSPHFLFGSYLSLTSKVQKPKYVMSNVVLRAI